MPRTRAEIKTLVQAHTGRTDKSTLIDSLCNSALQYAVMEHDFRNNMTRTSNETEIATNATSVSLAAFSPLVYKIITAKIIDTSDEDSSFLPLKSVQWWDRNVINPDDNVAGWPTCALFENSVLYFDRPCESDLKLRLLYTSIPSFTSDSTVCPIATLDLFVEYWVTAQVFASVGDTEKFSWWNRAAIGNDPTNPGGELRRAIRADEREAARERTALQSNATRRGVVTVDLDWVDGSSEHQQMRSWF